MLTVIDNHSVDLNRLGKQATVLDVGCRGMRFAEDLAWRGHRVIALDPDPTARPAMPFINVEFFPLALVPKTESVHGTKLVLTEDPEARYVIPTDEDTDRPYILVGNITLQELMRDCRVEEFDLIKMNMEGGEFDILDTMQSPLAKQIVVSFHEHTSRKRGQAAIDGLIQRLGKWYDVLRHEWDDRYCAGRNAWDTVLVRR
jgi:FkbM family methyltransferase